MLSIFLENELDFLNDNLSHDVCHNLNLINNMDKNLTTDFKIG